MSDPLPRSAVQHQRLGTPEHLDRALYVTTPKAWLALCALAVMLAAAAFWSAVGEVSTYVRAHGIILASNSTIRDVASPAAGRLARIVPAVGDTVAKGDPVAELFDAETMERYRNAMVLADERERALRDIEEQALQENAVAAQNLARQRERLDELESTGREMLGELNRRLLEDRELLAQGIADRWTVERTELNLDLARRNLFDALRRRDDLESAELRRRNSLTALVTAAQADRIEARSRMSELKAAIDAWRIEAPVAGRVIELKAQPGAIVQPGQPVLGIETAAEGIDVLIYVPPADGKRIAAGMPVLVSPTPYRREEFGSMTGAVGSIAEFPSSLDGMIAVLRNEALARAFSESGPPYPGRVSLTPDPSTASGFAWTSPHAADLAITSGTLAEIEIEVDRQPPAALVVPWIRGTLGL